MTLVTKAENPAFLCFNQKQIVSKSSFTKACKLRIHTLSNRSVIFESHSQPGNFVSVASNGQLYPENQLKAQAQTANLSQQFICVVKGCFRDQGVIMLCTSRLQTLCVDREPTALTAMGARNRYSSFLFKN